MYLGVDGGGTKTAYVLLDSASSVRAKHVGPSVSHISEGFERAAQMLAEGIGTILASASLAPADIRFAFIGLPSYGEDHAAVPRLDAMPAALLPKDRYRCGNDMICSWAGSLACADGISVIAGTGSMAYGEFQNRSARAGGWGELIGDEGSAYWIAREGMNLFSHMSDGRAERGPLHELVIERLQLKQDLDLCARVYGDGAALRRTFAQFAPLIDEAARAGDKQAAALFARGANELVQCVLAVRRLLGVPDHVVLPVSHTGGVFSGTGLMVDAFRAALAAAPRPFEYRAPLHEPAVGAALYAIRLAGQHS